MKKAIVLVGPTASGKTSLSIQLAKFLLSNNIPTEIVSADSRQIYTGLNCGTAKVTLEEMQGVPHHMLDVTEPNEVYSAHQYAHDAKKCIQDIWDRGGVPLVCGGTGFYIDALFNRVSLGNVGKNEDLRKNLEQKADDELFTLLAALDPHRAKDISEKHEKNNRVRLVRAIELAVAQNEQGANAQERELSTDALNFCSPGDILWIGLQLAPETLRKNIRNRLYERLANGMLDEVKNLHDKGLSWERMEKLGLEYRYCSRHVQGQISYSELETQLEQKIWQYSKRQVNYWKRNDDIVWYNPSEIQRVFDTALSFLQIKGSLA